MNRSKISQIAQSQGVSARALLITTFAKHGNAPEVASALGVTQGTVSIELHRAGLKLKTFAVDKAEHGGRFDHPQAVQAADRP